MENKRYYLTEDKHLVVDSFIFRIVLNDRFISPDMEKIKNQYWSYVKMTDSHLVIKGMSPYEFDYFYTIVAELLKEQGDNYHTEEHIRKSFRSWNVSLPEFLSQNMDLIKKEFNND